MVRPLSIRYLLTIKILFLFNESNKNYNDNKIKQVKHIFSDLYFRSSCIVIFSNILIELLNKTPLINRHRYHVKFR